LTEFDESREVVQSLIDEYKACETADYIKWGMEVRMGLSEKCASVEGRDVLKNAGCPFRFLQHLAVKPSKHGLA
jgi:hypothetical protein